jgi:hypothetical protein
MLENIVPLNISNYNTILYTKYDSQLRLYCAPVFTQSGKIFYIMRHGLPEKKNSGLKV